MRNKALLVGLIVAGSVLPTLETQASYTGITITSSLGAPGGQITYRIFAAFSDPDDFLTLVNGTPASPLHVVSRNASDTGPGSNFFESDGSAFDTWLGIGLGPPSPDVPGFIVGNEYLSTTVAVFTNGPQQQGQAGWPGDGDLLLRVLFMQLTVSSTSTVRGTVNIAGINNSPLAGGQSFSLTGQTFSSIPGPSGITLVSAAAIWRGRRRHLS